MSYLVHALPVWLFLVGLLALIFYTLHHGAKYDRYADRPGYEPEQTAPPVGSRDRTLAGKARIKARRNQHGYASSTIIGAAAVLWLAIGLAFLAWTLQHSVDTSGLVQPYGGCDEAWQAPQSEGARWCKANGFLD